MSLQLSKNMSPFKGIFLLFKIFSTFQEHLIYGTLLIGQFLDFTSLIKGGLQCHLYGFCMPGTTRNVFADALAIINDGNQQYLLTYRALLLLNDYSNFSLKNWEKNFHNFMILKRPIPEFRTVAKK